jgi:aminopeptidase N
MEMAYRLAIMRPREWQDILNRQRMLLKDNLTREEFDFVSRACTPDTQTRQNLANSLKKPQEKQQKQWVQHVLRLLNDR